MVKPNKLLEECNFDFGSIFTQEEIYSKNINKTLKDYTRQELERAHKLSQNRIEGGIYKGSESAKQIALLHDHLISEYLNFLSKYIHPLNNPTEAEKISVLATGGYGRGLLAPGSDIDLLFLLPYKKTAWAEGAIENTLYFLWDIGLKVGQATRTIPECLSLSSSDQTIATSLLDARHLWGNDALSDEFYISFREKIKKMSSFEFIKAKLDEREDRQNRAGQSRYLVEPNIKNGKGGLRDLEMLSWMTNFCYGCSRPEDMLTRGILTKAEAKTFLKCENFLWHVRCQLHYIANRSEEVINFNDQKEMAYKLGYEDRKGLMSVERFMRHYFLIAKEVGDLTRSICSILEERQKKSVPVISRAISYIYAKKLDGFTVTSGRINVPNDGFFKEDPLNILKLFNLSSEQGLFIHPNAIKVLRQSIGLVNKALREDKEANNLFLKILLSEKNAESTLRAMNETGVLGRFILDFGKIVGLMQFNMYHHFTADEHLLRAIGELNKLFYSIRSNVPELIRDLIGQGLNKKILTIALFFHDIAKGRDEDHSEVGALIVNRFSKRFSLTDYEVETISWLVREHLVMSDFSQTRDIMDQNTIKDFSSIVQTPERLKLLLILTIADITAVGPDVWSAYKGQLLEQLYKETYTYLAGDILGNDREARVKGRIEKLFSETTIDKDNLFKQWIKNHSDQYWLGLNNEIILRHTLMYVNDFRKKPIITIHNEEGMDTTEVSIMSKDSPGLFAKLTAAFSSMDINIVNAKIFTNKKGIAVDIIWIQDINNQPIKEKMRLNRIKDNIISFVDGKKIIKNIPISGFNDKRIDAFSVPVSIKIMNNISSDYTVIEVSGKDRPRILHDLAHMLNKMELNLFRAQVATFGERVVDVFYVLDSSNKRIEHYQSKKSIINKLSKIF